MKTCVLLLLVLGCVYGAPVGEDGLEPGSCDDPSAVSAAHLALTKINLDRREGYVFSLHRLSNVHMFRNEEVGVVYYLTLDVEETNCSVLSRKDWKACEARRPPGMQVYGQCKAAIYISKPHRVTRLYKYRCLVRPVPAARVTQVCPDCPTFVGFDNEQVNKTVTLSLKKFNKESGLNNRFALLHIARATAGMAMSMYYNVEYAIQETTCNSSTEANDCSLMTCEFAHTGFCKASLFYGPSNEPDVSVECEIFESEAALREKEQHLLGNQTGHSHNDTHRHDRGEGHSHHHGHGHGHRHSNDNDKRPGNDHGHGHNDNDRRPGNDHGHGHNDNDRRPGNDHGHGHNDNDKKTGNDHGHGHNDNDKRLGNDHGHGHSNDNDKKPGNDHGHGHNDNDKRPGNDHGHGNNRTRGNDRGHSRLSPHDHIHDHTKDHSHHHLEHPLGSDHHHSHDHKPGSAYRHAHDHSHDHGINHDHVHAYHAQANDHRGDFPNQHHDYKHPEGTHTHEHDHELALDHDHKHAHLHEYEHHHHHHKHEHEGESHDTPEGQVKVVAALGQPLTSPIFPKLPPAAVILMLKPDPQIPGKAEPNILDFEAFPATASPQCPVPDPNDTLVKKLFIEDDLFKPGNKL